MAAFVGLHVLAIEGAMRVVILVDPRRGVPAQGADRGFGGRSATLPIVSVPAPGAT